MMHFSEGLVLRGGLYLLSRDAIAPLHLFFHTAFLMLNPALLCPFLFVFLQLVHPAYVVLHTLQVYKIKRVNEI